MQTESLDYYWKLAKKLIMVHGHAGLIKDDDNIGFVARSIMEADAKYDPNIGNIEGYRSMSAKYAVLKLIKKDKKKFKAVSLNIKTTDNSYRDNSQNETDCKDLLEYAEKVLPDTLLEQIKDRYLNGCTWLEIAKKHNITQKTAKLNVTNAILKIKRKLCLET